MGNFALIADVATVAVRSGGLADPYALRPSTAEDLGQIAALYYRSYEPGIACATEEEAAAEVSASFAGDYGEYLHDASPVVLSGSTVLAAIMTVKRAPWDHTPTCPFIIDLFTAPEHRRGGLASALLGAAATAAAAHDESIALRVEDQNTAAIALYEALGFRRW